MIDTRIHTDKGKIKPNIHSIHYPDTSEDVMILTDSGIEYWKDGEHAELDMSELWELVIK